MAISTGANHTCAILTGGSIKCWGRNDYGQLGDGSLTHRQSPVFVSEIEDAVAITTSGYNSCAILTGGSIKCWGPNGVGQLGNGTTTNTYYVPVSVSGITSATAVSSTCALLTGGSVQCWGGNSHGQLGNGTNTNSSLPVSVINLGLTPTPTPTPTLSPTPDPTNLPNSPNGFEPYPNGFKFKNLGIDADTLDGGTFWGQSIDDGERWDIFNNTFWVPTQSPLPNGLNRRIDTVKKIEAFKTVRLDSGSLYENGICFGMSVAAAMSYVDLNLIENVLSSFPGYSTLFSYAHYPFFLSSPGISNDGRFDGENIIDKPLLMTIASLQKAYLSAERVQATLKKSPSQVFDFLSEQPATELGQYVIEFGYHRFFDYSHAVVPYKIDMENHLIYVYDPNVPDDGVRNTTNSDAYNKYFTMDGDSWHYVTRSGATWPSPQGSDLRFRLIDTQQLFRGHKFTPYGIGIEPALKFDGAGEMILSNAVDQKTGFQNGEYISEIPDAERLVDIGQDENFSEKSQHYVLPHDENISAEIIGTSTGSYDLVKAKGDEILQVFNVPTAAGVNDTISLGESGEISIRFDEEPSRTGNYYLSIVKELEGDPEFEAPLLPVIPGATFKFHMDWEALQAGENGVTIEVDSNSDGAVDQSIITGSELNDTIAPATTATLDGTEIPGFGYLPGAIVILAAADNEGGSGATTTEYSLGNGTSWLPYTTPLVFNAEGEVTLIYRSRDALGNQEESQTLEIRIVSARSLREALLPILDSLVTGKPAIDLKTKQMAKSIAASLTASYWQDRNHVVPPGGAAILIADSLAIGIAKTALGQSINPLPPVAAEAYRQSIASLLASDRILASLRLAEAKTHPVTGVLKQKLAQNYLQQAEAAFAKAEGESVAEPVRTVADYYSAWLLSGMVLKL